jgi:hypothetical protein
MADRFNTPRGRMVLNNAEFRAAIDESFKDLVNKTPDLPTFLSHCVAVVLMSDKLVLVLLRLWLLAD